MATIFGTQGADTLIGDTDLSNRLSSRESIDQVDKRICVCLEQRFILAWSFSRNNNHFPLIVNKSMGRQRQGQCGTCICH
jgi:hypothetical protein